MKKKLLALVAIVAILCTLCFTGCSSSNLSNIYKNHKSITEFDGYEVVGHLPANCNVATKVDAFSGPKGTVVVTQNGKYGVYNLKTKKLILDAEFSKGNFLIKKYFIASQKRVDNQYHITVRDFNGKIVNEFVGLNTINDNLFFYDSVPIYGFCQNRILSLYNANDKKSFISLAKNSNAEIIVYKDYLIRKTSKKTEIIKYANIHLDENQFLSATNKGTFISSKSNSIYTNYLGDGKFNVVQVSNADKDNYQYQRNKLYYSSSSYIYDAKNDTRKKINKQVLFFSFADKSTEIKENTGICVSDILKDDCYFVDNGLGISDNKMSSDDQFILDKDQKVLLSLSGNFGRNLSFNSVYDNVFSPLYLIFIDGVGFSINNAGQGFKLVNLNGKIACEKNDGFYQNAFYNNDALVIEKVFDRKDGTSYSMYGVFDKKGKLLIDFEYDYLSPFISKKAFAYNIYYKTDNAGNKLLRDLKVNVDNRTISYMLDNEEMVEPYEKEKLFYEFFIVDKNGNKTVVKEQVAFSKNNIPIIKQGVYIYEDKVTKKYGVKNYHEKDLFGGAEFSHLVIDKKGLSDVYIYGQVTNNEDSSTTIYKLTSKNVKDVNNNSVNDIIIPIVIVGCIGIGGAIIILIDKRKKNG